MGTSAARARSASTLVAMMAAAVMTAKAPTIKCESDNLNATATKKATARSQRRMSYSRSSVAAYACSDSEKCGSCVGGICARWSAYRRYACNV